MSNALKILVIDDDPIIGDSCRLVLGKQGHQVEVATTGAQGLSHMSQVAFDLVLLDLRMPDTDGMSLLDQLRIQDPQVPVIVISGYGSVQTVVEAMKLGAFDFVAKPFSPTELSRAVERAREKLKLLRNEAFLKDQTERLSATSQVVTSAPAMRQILTLMEKVAPTDTTVIFTGESGTGKGLMAQRLHAMSHRREHPFVALDCSTLIPTLFESELFGHVKGAFTGAEKDKIGKFELAHGGTLFFDEVSNISLDIQAKLLKAVEELAFSRVGSNRMISVDTRLVAATNQDLATAVKKGTFREDLYYRFNVIHLQLPPLRQRPKDVPLLARYFLQRYRSIAAVEVEGFTPRAMEMLKKHPWPGNVRELENLVQRLVLLAQQPWIDADAIKGTAPLETGPEAEDEPVTLAEMERRHIERTLARMGGHKSNTAQALGIDRKTLRQKLRRYDLA